MKHYLSGIAVFMGSGITVIALWIPIAHGANSVEVAKIAKAVTVNIDSPDSPGSGVIVQKNQNTYTVITAAHVVRNRRSNFTIITPDGQKYRLTNISTTKGTDLAVVKFQSTTNYSFAKFGDAANSPEGSTVYVAGFPVSTQAISYSLYNFTEGKVTANANRPLAEGYSLIYSNSTLPGMSGGPVFNEDGELIAIHGRGDTQESSQASSINQNVRVKTGFNLGITTTTLFKISGNLGLILPSNSVVTTRSTELKTDDFFLQGVDLFSQGKWSNSIELMDKAIATNPKYLRAYVAKGAANFMLNRVVSAIADTDQALSINANYAIAHVGKCFFLGEFGKYGEALGHCDRAVELAPNSSIAYNVRGGVKLLLNDISGAERDLLRSIELDPQSYYAYGNLGLVYLARNNPQVALRYTRQALQLNPNSAGIRVQFARALVGNKQYAMAIGEVDRALSINPRISNAYTVRSLAYRGLGNNAQADRDANIAQATARSAPQGSIEDLSFLSQ
jgi:tetratricopeptide (TPR) repeat protein